MSDEPSQINEAESLEQRDTTEENKITDKVVTIDEKSHHLVQ